MEKFIKSLILLVTLSVSLSAYSKVYVISDIDDTIKKANSSGPALPQAYHFLRKKIYPEMRDLFNELKDVYERLGEEVEVIYVSAAPDAIFNQQKWIKKHNFPAGRAILRRPGDGDTYTYKTNTITELLKVATPSDTVYFFGDNSSKDPIVYKEITEKFNLTSFIFIRDVSTEATFWANDLPITQLDGVSYFFSERELIGMEGLFFLSNELVDKIKKAYDDKELIPCYTEKTLKRRLKKSYGCGLDKSCRSIANENGERFWNDYHTRY